MPLLLPSFPSSPSAEDDTPSVSAAEEDVQMFRSLYSHLKNLISALLSTHNDLPTLEQNAQTLAELRDALPHSGPLRDHYTAVAERSEQHLAATMAHLADLEEAIDRMIWALVERIEDELWERWEEGDLGVTFEDVLIWFLYGD